MSNPKQFGAKHMFRQSIVYLFNSYREEGMNADDAKAQVAKDIAEVHGEYVANGTFNGVATSIANPVAIIDDIIKNVDAYSQKDKAYASFGNRILKPKLHRLKKVL